MESFVVGSDLAICVTDALLQPVRELEQTTHWKAVPVEATVEDGGISSIVYTPCAEQEQSAKKCSLEDLPPQQVDKS